MSEPSNDNPPLGELADDRDQLDWRIDRDGRMRHFATDPDGEPPTVPWEG